MEKQTLDEEKFKQLYRERFSSSDREVKRADDLHASLILRPGYFNGGLEPAGKKVKITSSGPFIDGKRMLSRLFDLEGATLIDSLEQADIGVHIGAYICSNGIWSWIEEAKKRDNLSLVVITNGSLYYRFCQNCPENKAISDLRNNKKIIKHIPMGWPYNKNEPVSWE
ncbi:MAG: hypothetical protein AABX16_02835 [Nanoarchaeota archaeon]